MKTVNIHEAKTHLSRLIEEAAKGQPFIIAKAGKPMVRVERVEQAEKPGIRSLFGALAGTASIPEDFFSPEADKEIEDLFHGEDPMLRETFERREQAERRERERGI